MLVSLKSQTPKKEYKSFSTQLPKPKHESPYALRVKSKVYSMLNNALPGKDL